MKRCHFQLVIISKVWRCNMVVLLLLLSEVRSIGLQLSALSAMITYSSLFPKCFYKLVSCSVKVNCSSVVGNSYCIFLAHLGPQYQLTLLLRDCQMNTSGRFKYITFKTYCQPVSNRKPVGMGIGPPCWPVGFALRNESKESRTCKHGSTEARSFL